MVEWTEREGIEYVLSWRVSGRGCRLGAVDVYPQVRNAPSTQGSAGKDALPLCPGTHLSAVPVVDATISLSKHQMMVCTGGWFLILYPAPWSRTCSSHHPSHDIFHPMH